MLSLRAAEYTAILLSLKVSLVATAAGLYHGLYPDLPAVSRKDRLGCNREPAPDLTAREPGVEAGRTVYTAFTASAFRRLAST